MVECARLESAYTERYRGFESLTLRKNNERSDYVFAGCCEHTRRRVASPTLSLEVFNIGRFEYLEIDLGDTMAVWSI